MIMANVHDAEGVPDPTDFPKSIKGLRALDESLRCSICLEIFDAPMSLPCGHSFCSLCIRENILTRKECARCRKQADDFHLTKNAQLEEAALNWKIARPAVLDLITQLENAKAEAERYRARLEKGKGKASPTSDAEERDSSSRPAKRRRTSADSGDDVQSTSTAHLVAEEEEDEEEDDPHADYIPSSDVEEQSIQEDGVVVCPINNKHKTHISHINAHIDSACTAHIYRPGHRPTKHAPASTAKMKPSAKSAWNSVFQSNSRTSSRDSSSKGKSSRSPSTTSTNERLPKVSYSVQKDKKIRDLLQEHGLSLNGTREQQIARHQHYVTLYNANLDRPPAQCKSTDELRRELRKWEDSLSVKKVEITDPKAYLRKNNDHFKAQVNALNERRRLEKKAANEGNKVVHIEASEMDESPHAKDNGTEQDDIVSDSEGEREIC
ncbi:hypothetical protein SCHPADRAFT_942681 [Schizopora paradoxa]|uniref:Postreplication repair E3 ubiquitin-protein ligase RAD18 n=1 Tax=Schizopora paradoxa TaxID=27342 RepID=A0A0H2RFS1_9AGAM|nr:hypothetical protein SCHPADRAFT_942681 [Schizopora paradoxa]